MPPTTLVKDLQILMADVERMRQIFDVERAEIQTQARSVIRDCREEVVRLAEAYQEQALRQSIQI